MLASRRRFLLAAAALSGCARPVPEPQAEEAPLALTDYAPKPAIVTPHTEVAAARFPAIDVHAHLILGRGNPPPDEPSMRQIMSWMDELNLQTLLNLTGGSGDKLVESIDFLRGYSPDKFAVCTQPDFDRVSEPDYPQWQADQLAEAKAAGAVGLKILKTLGLYLREEGKLVAVDDPRFDPMWAACGELGLPVFIHVSDPDAFFDPITPENERWEELAAHPDWSFYGDEFPSKKEILDARNRVIERHPNTQFVCLHFGNHPEDLNDVAGCLDRYPNMHVEMAARLGELGRQPRASRRFFEAYSDRILFGTDAIPLPAGANYPQQTLEPEMYRCYFRFLETADEYFDYSAAPTPPQGRWKIHGINLPDEILRKVYHDNAAKILGLA